MHFSLASVVELLNAQIGHNVKTFTKDRQPLVWLLAAVIGVVVAYLSILFRLSIGFWQYLWLGTMSEKFVAAAAGAPPYVIVLAPAFGGILVGYLLGCVPT